MALSFIRHTPARHSPQPNSTQRRHAHNYYIMGRQHAEDGNWDSARQLLLKSLACDPELNAAVRILAGVEFSLGNPAVARRYADRALAVNPVDADILLLMGNLAVSEGRPQEALARYHRVAEIEGSTPELVFNIGLTYLIMERVSDAIATFRRLVDEEPEYQRAWDALGCAYRMAKNFRDAQEAFRRALEIDPTLNDARDHLAQLLLETANPTEARRMLNQALEQEPDRTTSLHLLGMAYAAEQDFARASACWDTIVGQGKATPETYHLLASAYLHLGERKDALRVMEDLVVHHPEHPAGHLQLALLLLEHGQLERGWQHLEQAQALDPLNPTVATAFSAARAYRPSVHDSSDYS